jgi:purine-nucleoside phosphorylase
MAEQLERILLSRDHLRKEFPGYFNADTALIINNNLNLGKEFNITCKYSDIPPFKEDELFNNKGSIACAEFGKKEIILLNGRFNYFDGVGMRDIGHIIYLLRYLGVKKIISVDEAGYLNPRFKGGELALIYDHINLMADNPLIGKNENELGLRFPDMSNAYDKILFERMYKIFQDKKVKINEAVYIGVPGPATETEAEVRFYREIGADVVGYSMVPENITAVHAGMKFAGICLLTRELIADKMMEDDRSGEELENERKSNLKKCEKNLEIVLNDIMNDL